MRIKNLLRQGFSVCLECGEIFKMSSEDSEYLDFLSDKGIKIIEDICAYCNVNEFDTHNRQMYQLYLDGLNEFYIEEGLGEYTEAHLPSSLIEDMIQSGFYED